MYKPDMRWCMIDFTKLEGSVEIERGCDHESRLENGVLYKVG